MDNTFDVVIVGGGVAGLAAALALGRSRRSILVVDAGEPRTAPADHLHNYLGRDGDSPGDLVGTARDEVTRYGVEITEGRVAEVTEASATDDDPLGFRVQLADGRRVEARRLVVATGGVDELPAVPGIAEQWGDDVFGCPYCHGWEVAGRALGVLVTSPVQAHQILLLRQLSDDVTVFAADESLLDDLTRDRLAARGVRVLVGPVTELTTDGGAVTGMRTLHGEVVPIEALAIATTVEARIGFLRKVGIETTDEYVGEYRIGSQLAVGPTGETVVRGIYGAGNVVNGMAMLIAASASGSAVGAQVNADLAVSDADAAVTKMATAIL